MPKFNLDRFNRRVARRRQSGVRLGSKKGGLDDYVRRLEARESPIPRSSLHLSEAAAILLPQSQSTSADHKQQIPGQQTAEEAVIPAPAPAQIDDSEPEPELLQAAAVRDHQAELNRLKAVDIPAPKQKPVLVAVPPFSFSRLGKFERSPPKLTSLYPKDFVPKRRSSGITVVKGLWIFNRYISALSYALCVLSLLSIVSAVLYLDLKDYVFRGVPAPVTYVLNTVLSLCTIAIEICLILCYYYEFQAIKIRNPLYTTMPFYKTDLFVPCLMEIVLNAFHIPPFVDYYTIGTQYAEVDRYNFFVVLRLYLCLRLVRELSALKRQTGRVMGALVDLHSDVWFAIRRLFYHRPLLSLGAVSMLCLLICGYWANVFGRVINPGYYDFWQVLWMSQATMATIGYGDVDFYYDNGRAAMATAALAGTIISSLLVALVHGRLLVLTPAELQLIKLLESHDVYSAMMREAGKSVTAAFRMNVLRKRAEKMEEGLQKTLMVHAFERMRWKMQCHLHDFRDRRREHAGGTSNLQGLDDVLSLLIALQDQQRLLEAWNKEAQLELAVRFDALELAVRETFGRLETVAGLVVARKRLREREKIVAQANSELKQRRSIVSQ